MFDIEKKQHKNEIRKRVTNRIKLTNELDFIECKINLTWLNDKCRGLLVRMGVGQVT